MMKKNKTQMKKRRRRKRKRSGKRRRRYGLYDTFKSRANYSLAIRSLPFVR